MKIIKAANKIGKTQYPKTQTHWKNDICPPSNLVLMVTTNEPPHMIKNNTPNDFPLSGVSIPKFKTLNFILITLKAISIRLMDPINPLHDETNTIS